MKDVLMFNLTVKNIYSVLGKKTITFCQLMVNT